MILLRHTECACYIGATKKPEAGPMSDFGLFGYVPLRYAPLDTFSVEEQYSISGGQKQESELATLN
jgi:hypothetical protein